jgi:hypothetical protein
LALESSHIMNSLLIALHIFEYDVAALMSCLALHVKRECLAITVMPPQLACDDQTSHTELRPQGISRITSQIPSERLPPRS